MRIRHTVAAVGLLAVALGPLSACASTSGGATTTTSASSSSAAPDPAQAPMSKAELLDALTTGQLKAGSVHVSMTMGGSMSMAGEGDVDYSGATPEMAVRMTLGQPGTVRLRLVDGILYLQVPHVVPAGKFLRVDPHDPANPLTKSFGHLSDQMDPLAALRAMKAGVRSVEYAGAETVDGAKADHYVMTVDTAAVMRAMGQGSVPGLPRTLRYDVWMDGADRLVRTTFELSGMTTDLRMSKWGEPVTVTAPPAGRLVDSMRMAG
jgi:hypothetical protein